jgi:two-component system, response regulator
MTSPLTPQILLVEDNPEDAELAMRALLKAGVLNPVQVAEDGAEALDLIFSRTQDGGSIPFRLPRLIFLDIKLPKLDGFEVLKKLKAEERTRMIPVVMMTSSREISDIRRAYALGANSYLVKPVDSKMFFDVIGAAGRYWMAVNESIG